MIKNSVINRNKCCYNTQKFVDKNLFLPFSPLFQVSKLLTLAQNRRIFNARGCPSQLTSTQRLETARNNTPLINNPLYVGHADKRQVNKIRRFPLPAVMTFFYILHISCTSTQVLLSGLYNENKQNKYFLVFTVHCSSWLLELDTVTPPAVSQIRCVLSFH